MATKQINLSAGSTPLVTTAETVIITGTPYTYDNPNPYVGGEHVGSGQGVSINGIVNVTTGAGANLITIRVRYSTVGGAVVGGAGATITHTVAAATAYALPYSFEDLTRFAASGGIYVLTVQQGAASGNGAVQPATMEIMGA